MFWQGHPPSIHSYSISFLYFLSWSLMQKKNCVYYFKYVCHITILKRIIKLLKNVKYITYILHQGFDKFFYCLLYIKLSGMQERICQTVLILFLTNSGRGHFYIMIMEYHSFFYFNMYEKFLNLITNLKEKRPRLFYRSVLTFRFLRKSRFLCKIKEDICKSYHSYFEMEMFCFFVLSMIETTS